MGWFWAESTPRTPTSIAPTRPHPTSADGAAPPVSLPDRPDGQTDLPFANDVVAWLSHACGNLFDSILPTFTRPIQSSGGLRFRPVTKSNPEIIYYPFPLPLRNCITITTLVNSFEAESTQPYAYPRQ